MRVATAIARALYPDRCPGCGRFGSLLCERCAANLPLVGRIGRCGHCRARWTGPLNCPRCFSWLAIDRTIVACEMDGVARRLVHGLKYRGVEGFAAVMAGLILAAEPGPTPQLSVAVPLHRSRERRRGFNQADLLLAALDWPRLGGRLVRVRRTESQVGKRERERRHNVAGAFEYAGPSLDGQEIAVVDDVITTGATVGECARTLKEYGATSVTVVAFARAHYEPGWRAPIYE